MSQPRPQDRRDFDEIVVFTGDLVGSSKLSSDDLAKAMRVLELASREVARSFGSGVGRAAHFSAFRGDGWQCVGPRPAHALRGALVMRAHLAALGRPFDTRVSVGLGSGWIIDQPGLDVASGPAFELSGHGLDGIGQNRRFAVSWEHPPREAPLIRAIFALADEISRKWTPGQARVFARLLTESPRPSQEKLAAALGITQQSVAEHLTGGGDWALQDALLAVEEPR